MRADAAVRRLHLVGNADAAGVAHVLVDGSEIPGRKDDLTANAWATFGDERARSRAGGVNPVDRLRHCIRIPFACPGVILVYRPRYVGDRHDVHPRRPAVSTGSVEFVRADLDERCRVPVVTPRRGR